MKTMKVRPVLIESKDYAEGDIGIHITDNSLQIMQRKILGNKFFDTKDGSPAHGIVIPQQLIFISLEDKIEVGDKIYDKTTNSIRTAKNDTEGFKDYYFTFSKIIALQPQIPLTYIQQFIEEYNTGNIKDVEIEMKVRTDFKDMIDAIDGNAYEPKLTDGFVTIVNKKSGLISSFIEVRKDSVILYGAGKFHEESLKLDRNQCNILFIELWKFVNQDTISPVMNYTEEEIILLLDKFINEYLPISAIDLSHKWFEQNKKK